MHETKVGTASVKARHRHPSFGVLQFGDGNTTRPTFTCVSIDES